MRFLTLTALTYPRLAWPLLVICALLPTLATAQTHALRVSVHDVAGSGVAGVTVTLRTEAGQEIARQTTDSEGAATFDALPPIVRVAVAGQARGGPRLYQLGDDAQGVRLDLADASGVTHLALRVERDGLVLPDPATMLSLEEGGPTVEQFPALPPAVAATPVLQSPTSNNEEAAVVQIGDAPTERRHADWVPAVTLLLVVAALGVLRLVQKLRGAR